MVREDKFRTARIRLALYVAMAFPAFPAFAADAPSSAPASDVERTKARVESLLQDASRRVRNDDVNGAIEALLEAQRLQPADDKLTDRLLALYDQAGDPARKIPLYLQRLTRNPTELTTLAALSATCYQLDDSIKAREWREKALATAMQKPDPYQALSTAYRQHDLHREELAVLKEGCAALPEDSRLHYERARALEQTQRHEEAIAVCETFLEVASSRLIEGRLMLLARHTGTLDATLERHRNRVHTLRQTLGAMYWRFAAGPGNEKSEQAPTYRALAVATGVPEPERIAAPPSREELDRTQVRFRDALRLLTQLARETGDSVTMLAAMEEMAQHGPLDIDAQLELASAQLDYGSVEAAQAALGAVLELDPEELRALHLSVLLATDQGEVQRAAEYRSRIESAKPSDEKAHYDAASYFYSWRQRMKDESRFECERVLAIAPHNSRLDESAIGLLAHQAAESKDYIKAAELQEQAQRCRAERERSTKPGDPPPARTGFYHAMACIQQGRESEALPLFEQMLAESRSNGRVSRHLGDLFFHEKMYRLAVRAYEQAGDPGGAVTSRPLSGVDRAVVQRALDAARELGRYEKPRRALSDHEMREFMQPLGALRWMQDDPYAPARWIAVEGRFVWLDDYTELQIERFPEFRAAWASPPDVNAMAFSSTCVWAATNVGLLCFDRNTRQWTQRIIPGVKPDTAADDVSCGDGKVRVTVGNDVYILNVSQDTGPNARATAEPPK